MHRGEFTPFCKEPYFYVENPHIDRENQPIVKLNVSKDEFKVYTLAKAGWYGGSLTEIYNAPIDEVWKAYDFEIMTRQYKSTAIEMSKNTQ